MEKYLLLYNFKNTRNKEKWNILNNYIKKYKIEVIKIDKYLSGTIEEKCKKLQVLADHTVDVDLNYAGLEHLINLRVKEIPNEEEIVTHPNDYLKSFILVIMDQFGEILEVIPNGTDRLSEGGSITRYFKDMYE